MKRTQCHYKVFLICGLIVMLAIIIFLFTRLYSLQQKIDEVQQTANTLTQALSVSNNVQMTESTQSLSFLQNETANFREFVENQQNYLITLLTLLGTGLVGLLAFLGMNTKKDIENTVQRHYMSLIQKEIENTIGGKGKQEYLIRCINKENLAQTKKILFLFQQEENKNLLEVYNILEDNQYNVSRKKVNGVAADRELRQWAKGNDIIIYQVNKNELIDPERPEFHPDESTTYARLSKECNAQKVYSILYCESHTGLVRSLYSSDFYTNNANYGLTVLERIFNLLYFI